MHCHSFLFSVMCKCSYLNEDDLTSNKVNRVVALPSSGSSSHNVATSNKDEAKSCGRVKRGKLTVGSAFSADTGSGGVDKPDWPAFADDEDYIVFCFERGGAFHVIQETPKPNNPKVKQHQCEKRKISICARDDKTKVVNQLKSSNKGDCSFPTNKVENEPSSNQLTLKMLTDVGNHLLSNKYSIQNEPIQPIKCRTTDSSHLDDELQLATEKNSTIDQYSSSPWGDCLLPNREGDDNVSSIESDELRGFSESKSMDDHKEQRKGNEVALESDHTSVSRQSNCSTGSIKFPVFEEEWIGSPVIWPRPEKVHYKKRNSQPTCLRCCKFSITWAAT